MLEIFPEMTVGTIRESIQEDTQIPTSSQHIYHNGKLIADDSKTVAELEIADGDILAMHVRNTGGNNSGNTTSNTTSAPPAPSEIQPARPAPSAPGNNDPELVRLQILGDPNFRQQLQRQQPELAGAVEDPVRFAQILRDHQDREQRERAERQREIARLNDDPFNIENQRRIEEMIRQERVMENLQNAMEHNPEGNQSIHSC